MRRRLIDHGFNVVAIRIENEAGIVVRSVLRAWTGRPIIGSPSLESDLVEGLHFRPVAYPEGHMHARQGWLTICLLDLEQAAVANIEGPEHVIFSEGKFISQRCKCSLVEQLAPGKVAHRDGYMIYQARTPEMPVGAVKLAPIASSLNRAQYSVMGDQCRLHLLQVL